MKTVNDINFMHNEPANISNLYDKIREYMTNRRTCSAANLSTVFDTSLDSIWKVLNNLEEDRLIRISRSACSGSCGTCSSECSDNTADDNAVVISLLRKESEDDC